MFGLPRDPAYLPPEDPAKFRRKSVVEKVNPHDHAPKQSSQVSAHGDKPIEERARKEPIPNRVEYKRIDSKLVQRP